MARPVEAARATWPMVRALLKLGIPTTRSAAPISRSRSSTRGSRGGALNGRRSPANLPPPARRASTAETTAFQPRGPGAGAASAPGRARRSVRGHSRRGAGRGWARPPPRAGKGRWARRPGPPCESAGPRGEQAEEDAKGSALVGRPREVEEAPAHVKAKTAPRGRGRDPGDVALLDQEGLVVLPSPAPAHVLRRQSREASQLVSGQGREAGEPRPGIVCDLPRELRPAWDGACRGAVICAGHPQRRGERSPLRSPRSGPGEARPGRPLASASISASVLLLASTRGAPIAPRRSRASAAGPSS